MSVFGIDDMPPVTLKTVEYGKLALGVARGIHERCAHAVSYTPLARGLTGESTLGLPVHVLCTEGDGGRDVYKRQGISCTRNRCLERLSKSMNIPEAALSPSRLSLIHI